MPKREKRSTDAQHKAKALSRWENEGGAKAKETKRRGKNIEPRSATSEAVCHQHFMGQRSANE